MINNLIIATSVAKCEEIYAQIEHDPEIKVVRSGTTEYIVDNYALDPLSKRVDLFVFPGNGISHSSGHLLFLPRSVFVETLNGDVLNIRDRTKPSDYAVCKVKEPFWLGDCEEILARYPIVTQAVKSSLSTPIHEAVLSKLCATRVFYELHFKEMNIPNREEL